ncbi:hypothetical protein QBC34DRAFT_392866 [Podospora aff. communis PSN243]|uniref:Secreted protein n=1 Tax=Podospora aff. communis PSN243 TaxID=3040156 RepID=A0AAV9H1N1_9PEZI|nr:hypothetical protein QBC34DRAFT_392866 [Podospora aff. communis PSN243]
MVSVFLLLQLIFSLAKNKAVPSSVFRGGGKRELRVVRWVPPFRSLRDNRQQQPTAKRECRSRGFLFFANQLVSSLTRRIRLQTSPNRPPRPSFSLLLPYFNRHPSLMPHAPL